MRWTSLTIVIALMVAGLAVPAASQDIPSVNVLRNPSVEGPSSPTVGPASAGDATGFEFLYGNGETSATARTGLQSVNLGPSGVDTMPWGPIATLRMIPVNPHGAGAPVHDGGVNATVATVPFSAVDSYTIHYNVLQPLDEADARLQLFFYLHAEDAVNTFGSSDLVEPFQPQDYACPIVTDRLPLSQTSGWESLTVDRSTEVRGASGFCGGGPVQTLGQYQAQHPDARLLYGYVQALTAADTWPADQPILVDDITITADLASLAE